MTVQGFCQGEEPRGPAGRPRLNVNQPRQTGNTCFFPTSPATNPHSTHGQQPQLSVSQASSPTLGPWRAKSVFSNHLRMASFLFSVVITNQFSVPRGEHSRGPERRVWGGGGGDIFLFSFSCWRNSAAAAGPRTPEEYCKSNKDF